MVLTASPSVSVAQEVEEFFGSDSLRVGDKVTFSFTLELDQDYDNVVLPDSSHFGSDFEIIDRERHRLSASRDSVVYELQFFGTEDSEIPRLPIHLVESNDTTSTYTTAIPVYFKTVLASEDEEFRPLKPIFDFAAALWPYLLALLLIAAAGWYLYKKYYLQEPEPEPQDRPEFTAPPFEDPLRSLSHRLENLKNYTFRTEKDFDRFYVSLGDAIRTYFEHLYKIPALESTSREIIYELDRRAVDPDLIAATKNVLREADMVKFAKFTPTEEQAALALEKGEQFLKRARRIDGPKVEQMHREHTLKVEEQRKAFEEEFKTETAEKS